MRALFVFQILQHSLLVLKQKTIELTISFQTDFEPFQRDFFSLSRCKLHCFNRHFQYFTNVLLYHCRAVGILPNRFIGVVGEHGEFPIEQIGLSPDGNILASCSHDQKIKFWNVTHFRETALSEEIPEKPKNNKSTERENFFEDL